MKKERIVIITGPTGVGKTRLSLRLAQIFNAEIISADSMQIYRYMNIGAAKPTPEEQALVPHHLIDIRNPDEDYSAAEFKKDADKSIKEVIGEERSVFVVGGTMLYLRVLTKGLFEAPKVDYALRERFKALCKERGNTWLHQRLKDIDPKAARRIHPKDTFRIIRALEVFELTGKPISRHQEQHRFKASFYDYLKICLNMPRSLLYERINHRVEKMFSQGLIDEVEELLKMGYKPNLKSMKSIGYRHVVEYLQGKFGLENTKEKIKQATRHYAKRQLTWFRYKPEVNWYNLSEEKKIIEDIKHFYQD
ncbi:MAG: hypothetical protein AMJ45_02360 [Syntrophobacter sp. DG_60]|nr:MAG: hypothetical protein AMJ45_02360 [Syntrophobacter sp. DG_60]